MAVSGRGIAAGSPKPALVVAPLALLDGDGAAVEEDCSAPGRAVTLAEADGLSVSLVVSEGAGCDAEVPWTPRPDVADWIAVVFAPIGASDGDADAAGIAAVAGCPTADVG